MSVCSTGAVVRVVVLNKPFDVVTRFTLPANAAPGTRTLAEFVHEAGLYPAGLLDRDSEGLVVLTSDGRLQHCLTDPRHGHERTYVAQVEGEPDQRALARLADGSLAAVDARVYDTIPLNTRERLFDLVLRNARVVSGGGLPPYRADVGMNFPATRASFAGSSGRGGRGGVFELGDLTDFLGKTEMDLTGRLLVVAPPGGEDGWKKVLAALVSRGRATAAGVLTLSEADLSAEAKGWLGNAPALAPGYNGDFLVLRPEGEGRFRVERRISPVER